MMGSEKQRTAAATTERGPPNGRRFIEGPLQRRDVRRLKPCGYNDADGARAGRPARGGRAYNAERTALGEIDIGLDGISAV